MWETLFGVRGSTFVSASWNYRLEMGGAQDGITFGAFSLYLKPRDVAKFGQLLLQKGQWNGQSVVDSAWIDEASQPLMNSGILGTP